jgi:ribonucleotide reductase beta subunit family protein with ferritin-like domain
MSREPLENAADFRYTFLPVTYGDVYEFYKKAQNMQWTPEEIKEELGADKKGWASLEPAVQSFIKGNIAFFNISDGVVVETLSEQIQTRIQSREVKVWYNHQTMMEDVHSEVYSRLAEEYVSDPQERKMVFDSVRNYPSIGRKIDWIHKWVGGDNNPFKSVPSDTMEILRQMAAMFQKTVADFLHLIEYDTELQNPKAPIPKLDIAINHILENTPHIPLAQIIMANAILEGLFFSSAFASIFWINHYYKGRLPGLAKANEWISRDEGMHTDFAIMLYRRHIRERLSTEVVHKMFKEALEVETDFINSTLPTPLKGMNATLMIQYVKFVADGLLNDLSYPKLFNVANPFEWMTKQSISVRMSDFFIDPNVSEYTLPNDNGLSFGEDF